MRSKSGVFFECKVRYEKVMEDGLAKIVPESYVVEALTFSEAEKRVIESMTEYVREISDVDDIKKAQYKEIFFTDVETDDKWYKARLAFITIDENTGKEKRSNVTYLVQGDSLNGALKHVDEVMKETMIDYQSVALVETKLVNVFEYKDK